MCVNVKIPSTIPQVPSCYFCSIELPGASAVESKRRQLPIFSISRHCFITGFFYLPSLQDNNWPHGEFPLPAEIHFGEQLPPLPVLHLQLLLQLDLRRLEVLIGQVIEVHVARHDEPGQEKKNTRSVSKIRTFTVQINVSFDPKNKDQNQ